MNISYLLYQAERTRGAAEQREVDAQAAEFAAAIAGLARAGRRAVTWHRRTARPGFKRAGRPNPPATVPCGMPCP